MGKLKEDYVNLKKIVEDIVKNNNKIEGEMEKQVKRASQLEEKFSCGILSQLIVPEIAIPEPIKLTSYLALYIYNKWKNSKG